VTARQFILVLSVLVLAAVLSGCGLTSAITTTPTPGVPAAANPGEQQGSIPKGAPAQRPVDPAASPQAAITRFASLYINWSYRTLAGHERRLAASAIGDARLAESQAAASAERDRTLAQAHIYNRGSVISVAAVIGGPPGEYAVVTREATGGDPEYAGLQSAFHVTLATVQQLPTGWVLREWQPQS